MKKNLIVTVAGVLAIAALGGVATIQSNDIGLEVSGPETAAVGQLVEFNASGADSYSWVLLPASENQRVLGDTLYFSAQVPGLYTFVVSGTREGKIESKVVTLTIATLKIIGPKVIDLEVDDLKVKLDDWIGNLDKQLVVDNINAVLDEDHKTVDSLLNALARRNRETLNPEYQGFLMRLGVYMELQLAGTDLKIHLEFLIQLSEALQ